MNEPKPKEEKPVEFLSSLSSHRRQLYCNGVLQTPTGRARCTVNNISKGGANLSLEQPIDVGTKVSLTVAGFGTFQGYIVWQDDTVCGMRFTDGARVPIIDLMPHENRRAK